MRVRTLRKHHNSHGDNYEKKKGSEYEHPSPSADIKAGFVKEAKVKPEPENKPPTK